MKEINRLIAILLLGLTSLCANLTAQEHNKKPQIKEGDVFTHLELSEEELIAKAMERNFQVKIQGLEAKVTKELKVTAFELPKAEVSAQYGHYDGPDNNLAFEISQTLPFPTLFWAKAQQLKEDSKTAELRLEMQKNEVRQAVRVLYEQLRHKQQQLHYKDMLLDAYVRYYNLVAKRYELGEVTKQELTIAEIKRTKTRFESQQLLLEVQDLYRKLGLLCGLKDFNIPITKELEVRSFSLQDFENPIGDNLDLKLLNSEVRKLKAEKNVSLSEQLPDITFGYQNSSSVGIHTIEGKDVNFGIKDRLNSFSLGLSIPLNVFASRARVKAAKLKMQAKEVEVQQTNREVETTYLQLVNKYSKDKYHYEYYHFEALPNAIELLKLAEESYKLGETTYLDYVQALETVDDIRETYINYSLDLNLSIINIYALFNK